MKRVHGLPIVLCLLVLSPSSVIAQQIGLRVGILPNSMEPIRPSVNIQPDARTYWPEPLPILSTYPLTPAFQPLPQLYVPRLPVHGMLLLPQPVSTNPSTTFMLFGPFWQLDVTCGSPVSTFPSGPLNMDLEGPSLVASCYGAYLSNESASNELNHSYFLPGSVGLPFAL
jgi:hypothetical protein